MPHDRKIIRSQFIPKSNWGHSLSPLSHVEFGSNFYDPNETTHSSAWLWNATSAESVKPRFSLGYPEEYQAFLEKSDASELLEKVNLDLWIFRDLSEAEVDEIVSVMVRNRSWKLIFISHNLNSWKKFFSESKIKLCLERSQAFLSFLPSSSAHDSMLSPQQVLWNLEKIPEEIPLLLIDVPETKITFYNSLDKSLLAQQIKRSNFFLISLFKFFDKLGLTQLLLFMEAFFGFFVSYKMQRFIQAFKYFFDFSPWIELSKRLYLRSWHKYIKPLFSQIWFSVFWPLLNLFWFKIFYRIGHLSWNFIKDQLGKRLGIFIWHKLLKPAFSFIYFKIGLKTYHLIYNLFLKKYSLIFWGKVALPLYQFTKYKILLNARYILFIKPYHLIWNLFLKKYSLLLWGKILVPTFYFVRDRVLYSWPKNFWVLLRHKIIQPLYSFIRFFLLVKIWVLVRYKLLSFIIFLAYPIRKIRWFLKYQYEKRIKYKGRAREA